MNAQPWNSEIVDLTNSIKNANPDDPYMRKLFAEFLSPLQGTLMSPEEADKIWNEFQSTGYEYQNLDNYTFQSHPSKIDELKAKLDYIAENLGKPKNKVKNAVQQTSSPLIPVTIKMTPAEEMDLALRQKPVNLFVTDEILKMITKEEPRLTFFDGLTDDYAISVEVMDNWTHQLSIRSTVLSIWPALDLVGYKGSAQLIEQYCNNYNLESMTDRTEYRNQNNCTLAKISNFVIPVRTTQKRWIALQFTKGVKLEFASFMLPVDQLSSEDEKDLRLLFEEMPAWENEFVITHICRDMFYENKHLQNKRTSVHKQWLRDKGPINNPSWKNCRRLSADFYLFSADRAIRDNWKSSRSDHGLFLLFFMSWCIFQQQLTYSDNLRMDEPRITVPGENMLFYPCVKYTKTQSYIKYKQENRCQLVITEKQLLLSCRVFLIAVRLLIFMQQFTRAADLVSYYFKQFGYEQTEAANHAICSDQWFSHRHFVEQRAHVYKLGWTLLPG
jgi:hypothetical protein